VQNVLFGRYTRRKLNIGKGKKKEKDKGEGRKEPEGARALRVALAPERRQTNSHG
jgi:hypothetical protein